MKRYLLLLAAFLPFIAMFGTAENDSIINFTDSYVKKVCIAHWDVDNDGELSMSEAASVTDLGTFFSGNKLIKSFHELRYFTGLSTIAEAAFYDCSNLRELTFPNQLKSIGERAFGKCTNLYFDSFPKSITEIGRIAFYNCFALTSLEIPDAVTHIGNQAFYRCKGAKSVKIGKSVSIIPYNAFANCEGLKTVTIPCTVDTVGSRAFEGCISLSSVIIEDGESELIFMPERDERNTFENCPLQNLYIGRSININMGLSPFKNNTKLTTLTIGEKVGIIDERNGYAFKGCKNLLTVCVKSVNPPIVREASFERYDAVLMVPVGASSTYKTAPVWKKFTNICEFDTDGIQNISKEHNPSSTIYDIYGLPLNGTPQKGIYIQNGKKYVK